jgi:hypothetical protein
MEHGYIRIKEGLRRIRKECDEFSRKTDGVRKLSKDIKQMEDFQKILSMGIEHKILGAKGKNTCFEITGLCPDEASLMTSVIFFQDCGSIFGHSLKLMLHHVHHHRYVLTWGEK